MSSNISEEAFKSWMERKRNVIQGVVIFTLLLPLFFQLQGSIYTNTEMNFDSKGILTQLPLPISSITCFIGLAFLVRYKIAVRSVSVLFALFILMLLSTFTTSLQIEKDMLSKLILLVQTILPVFALALGQSYKRPKNVFLRFESIFLYILALVVPLEVFSTLMSSKRLLSPNWLSFSIYQHLEYVPVVFVGLYFLALGALKGKNILGWLVIFLAPFMGVYTAASLSMLAIFLGLSSSVGLIFLCYKFRRCNYALVSALIFILSFGAYYSVVKSTSAFEQKFGSLVEDYGLSADENYHVPENIKVKSNVKQRLEHWHFYLEGTLEGPSEFVFGNPKRPDRKSFPSAHNYYLDLAYNFGFVAVIPFLYLISFTLKEIFLCYKRGVSNKEFWWLSSIVLFFILVDNFFKVGLRQPYPGIIMFFLWGALLGRLSEQVKLVGKEFK